MAGGVKINVKIPDALKVRLLQMRIRQQARKAAGRGLEALKPFLLARIKETVSVPAPRRRVVPKDGRPPYYVATTAAVPYAPVRKLSGALRMRLTARIEGYSKLIIGCNAKSSGKNPFPYPAYHELILPGMPGSGKHPFVVTTIDEYKNEIVKILGMGFRIEFAGTV